MTFFAAKPMPTTLRLLLLLMLGLFGLQPVGYAYDAPVVLFSGAQNIVAAIPESQAATAAPVPLNFHREGGALDGQADTRTFSNFVAAESEGGLVIGKLEDLAKETGWRTGDRTLHLPPRPPGPERWGQNARALLDAIKEGKPIRDISPTKGGRVFGERTAVASAERLEV